jgi:6-phosphofructokinase 1
MDRLIASRMGYHAVECLMEGKHNVFVGHPQQQNELYCTFDEAVKKETTHQ